MLSDEHDLYLAYYLQNTPEGWDGTSVRVVDLETNGEPIAIVKFPLFLAYQFGPTNDEVFSGHPLSSLGLGPYGTYEIENSKWIGHFEKMNSVHPSHLKEHFERYKHFIFSFHDTTLEVIAKSFEFEAKLGSLKEAINTIKQKLEW